MEYEEALWKWFVANASKDQRFGYAPLSTEERDHLTACGINMAVSELPGIGTVPEWNGTDAPLARVSAVYTDQWECNCATYGNRYARVERCLTLAVTGSRSLGDIIREVVEIGGQ